MGKKFSADCNEATTICDKNQYGEASLLEKLRLIIHLWYCRYCRTYSKQNQLMTNLIGKFVSPSDRARVLSADDKESLEIKLAEELKKKSGS